MVQKYVKKAPSRKRAKRGNLDELRRGCLTTRGTQWEKLNGAKTETRLADTLRAIKKGCCDRAENLKKLQRLHEYIPRRLFLLCVFISQWGGVTFSATKRFFEINVSTENGCEKKRSVLGGAIQKRVLYFYWT